MWICVVLSIVGSTLVSRKSMDGIWAFCGSIDDCVMKLLRMVQEKLAKVGRSISYATFPVDHLHIQNGLCLPSHDEHSQPISDQRPSFEVHNQALLCHVPRRSLSAD